MIKRFLITVIFLLASSVMGQDAFYTVFKYDGIIPNVKVNDQSHTLQKSVVPQMYKNRQVRYDINWLTKNDSALVIFWEAKGDTILHVLSELSGIRWVELDFDIHFVRYYPTIGSSDPLIIPIGGISNGKFTIAAPEGKYQQFNLIYQLSRRMLSQAGRNRKNRNMYYVANHPLMQPTEFRRDNLAMVLAVNAAYSIIDVGSTDAARTSTFWKNNFPGKVIYNKYLKDKWFLSPDKTITDWLIDEPYNSKLVQATKPPRRKTTRTVKRVMTFIEDLPLKGSLGFSVRHNDAGQLVINKIDSLRLAFAAGIRENDIIRRVDGKLVRNHKALTENILTGLEKSGSVIEVSREGMIVELIIQTVEQELYRQESDSLYFNKSASDIY